MTLRRLKWLTIVAPVAFFVALILVQGTLQSDDRSASPARLLSAGVVVLAALLFSEVVFGVVGRLQERLTQRNQELLALHQAGLGIAGELGLEAVLQKIVEQARELISARYGALSVPGAEGSTGAFLTAGRTPEERARVTLPLVEHGMLGASEARGVQRHAAGQDRSTAGSGANGRGHPAVRPVLAVPILSRGQVLGDLYLSQKVNAPGFSAEDEQTVIRFATQAALAIENARLHRTVRELAIIEERERIAREMHDSLAQVLGYVNTKAQAVEELLEAGRPERAATQLGQLSEAARSAYADVREGILGLRTSLGPDRDLSDTLRDYLDRWQEQSDVPPELTVEIGDASELQLSPAAELQLVRIVQEALSNVRKHASASRAWVRIGERDGCIEAVIADDGVGFNPAAPGRGAFPRFGLATMRERAEAAGGSLEIESTPGSGTRVTARLPGVASTDHEGRAVAHTNR